MTHNFLPACLLCVLSRLPRVAARDFFLTIGGGHSRESNQASLEKNVLFYQQLLKEQNVPAAQQSVYFAAGPAGGKDVQAIDADSLPKANRLMAEFFGTERDLGLHYRTSEVPDIRGATTRENIEKWFKDVGPTLKSRRPALPLCHRSRREVRRPQESVRNVDHALERREAQRERVRRASR